MDLNKNVFEKYNIKLHNLGRMNKRIHARQNIIKMRPECPGCSPNWFQKTIKNHVTYIKRKYNFQIDNERIPIRPLQMMEKNFQGRAKLNYLRNRKRNRCFGNQGEAFKEHRQRETWYRLQKNPFLKKIHILDYRFRMKKLRFGFDFIQLFSRFQKH